MKYKMSEKELKDFEEKLINHGYKKVTCGKVTYNDDYEYYKPFYDNDNVKYQIFFEIWNFEKYQMGAGFSLSVTILPESCVDNVGRRDLKLSTDYCDNIEIIEYVAYEFYKTIIKIDKYAKENY